MGQALERFSSVSEEKKNKEIERIVEKVYEKYLEAKTAKPSGTSSDKPQTSNQTEGNKKSIEASQTSSNGSQPSSQTAGNKKSTDPSEKKAPEEENKKSNEALEYKANFYRAVCEVVGELNQKFGNTQFKLPSKENLEKVFKTKHDPAKPVSKEDFQKMLQGILERESVFAGFGATDALIYIFTVPAAAVFAKQRYFPRAIPNDVLIPGVTSATVFALAKLNKI